MNNLLTFQQYDKILLKTEISNYLNLVKFDRIQYSTNIYKSQKIKKTKHKTSTQKYLIRLQYFNIFETQPFRYFMIKAI